MLRPLEKLMAICSHQLLRRVEIADQLYLLFTDLIILLARQGSLPEVTLFEHRRGVVHLLRLSLAQDDIHGAALVLLL